jgi:hypothetical protein
MAFTTKEIVLLRWLLADMRVFFSHPTPMNYDNQSSIQIAHNSVFMSELSTLRSIVILLVIISSMAPLLCLLFILPCRLQIADFFTKTHSISHFRFLVDKLSMLVDAAS